MDENYRPIAKADMEKSQMGDETLLYNSANDKVTVLNRTAASVWELCDGKHTISQIADKISECYDTPDDCDVARDVVATIQMFRQDGILLE
ncbi:MAG: PqqD family protein [Candidatus Coatesbacteria bacterium]|nr:PqqD family protein [Candidatus Coatesbacteria bacterium]